jgi:UDP-2-acetamido-3-amino-2,3-dideoxy-glucuronate N-acetyltransferase
VEDVFIHPTAEVAPDAWIGKGTRIWNQSQIRTGAHIGADCNLGKNVYIDVDVMIGERVKIQNNVSIYHGVTIEDGVFIGPHVCFTNDVLPRAITPEGQIKGQDDWMVGSILVRTGASIGAGSVILPDVTIGEYALIGAGSVVTRSVPAHALMYGNPARQHGYVCRCGQRLINVEQISAALDGFCPSCNRHVKMPLPVIPRAESEAQPDYRLFV